MNSSPGTPLRYAAVVGLVYAAAGALWILVSDSLVSRWAPNAEWLAVAQRYKGLGFVAITALGLVFLIRGGFARLLDAQRRADEGALQVQDLFARHPTPMWVYDVQTLKFLAVNESAVRHYGYSLAEFLSMSIQDIRPATEVPLLTEALRLTPAEGHNAGIFVHSRKSGERISVEITSHDVPFAGYHARLVMAQDITREAEARAALVRQERQFRQLLDSLSEALWVSSVDGNEILYVSSAFEHVYGRESGELQRNPDLWRDVVVEDDRMVVLQAQEDFRATGQSEAEYRIQRPDGELRWVCDRRRAIVGMGGEPEMLGGIVLDISRAKLDEAALNELNLRLETRVAERTKELRFVNQELDAFTRTAAHDLKSPLGNIMGLAQLLRLRFGGALGSEGGRFAELIETSADSMSTLVTDLLALSRVTIHELHRTSLDLGQIALQELSALQRADPERSVTIAVEPALVVLADEGLARSLMTNLVANAWKYSGKRPDAEIGVGRLEATEPPVFFVRDNGIGFDMVNAERLFKPFQRFHSATEFSGTGVGLATCQRIVRRHGGSIWITSKLGQGTSVFFSLSPAQGASAHPAIPSDSFFANLS